MFRLFKKKPIELSPLVREAIAQMQIEEDWRYVESGHYLTNDRFRISGRCNYDVATWLPKERRFGNFTHEGLGETREEEAILWRHAAPLFTRLHEQFVKQRRIEQLELVARPSNPDEG